MWSGGAIENAAGVEEARARQLDLQKKSTEEGEAVRTAQNGLQDANRDEGKVERRRDFATGDKRKYEGEEHQYTGEVRQRGLDVESEQHSLQTERDQHLVEERQLRSFKELADVTAFYTHLQFSSYVRREVAAFFAESQQRMGEIINFLVKMNRKFAASMQQDITKPQMSTEMDFKHYTNHMNAPSNAEMLSLNNQFQQKLKDHISRGELIAKKERDPFTKRKLDESLAKLREAQGKLSKAKAEYDAAESAKKVVESAVKSARDTFDRKTDDQKLTHEESRKVGADLENYDARYKERYLAQQQRRAGAAGG